ncbi:MAG TPA: D-glycerate dehydrogenase [Candidatus Latescibacteria bacterium]|nr:D-glycerate dehydrogenase [Candidatus Latescibacterota bacterium]
MPYHVMISDTPPDSVTSAFEGRCDVQIWPQEGPSDEQLNRIQGFVTYGHMRVNGALMDRMPHLKVISAFGVGVDHINLQDAGDREILVGNTPNIVNGATADMTFALLLAATRNLLIGDAYARGPKFTVYDLNILHGGDAFGATLGIVGMGKIGKEVARRARAFDMRILYHNRNRDTQAESDLGVEYRTLDELLAESDFITLNCPLTEETHHLIGEREFALMKEKAVLVNVARGGVVDHDALFETLQSRRIACAAVDVTEPEPLPRDHPLLALDNIIIAPHLGTATRQTRQRMAQRCVDNLLAGLEGKPLPSEIKA